MNKEFLKKTAAVMTAAAMLSSTAAVFAAEDFKIADNGVSYSAGTLTVNYTGVDASSQASLLVYNIDGLLSELSNTDYVGQTETPIVAIDQTAANGSFTAKLPSSVAAGQHYMVKVGATGENTPASETFVIPNDAAVEYGELDGTPGLSANDAVQAYARAKSKLSSLPSGIETWEEFDKRADVDGTPGVSANDAVQIYAKAKGKITQFPVEEGGAVNPQ